MCHFPDQWPAISYFVETQIIAFHGMGEHPICATYNIEADSEIDIPLNILAELHFAEFTEIHTLCNKSAY